MPSPAVDAVPQQLLTQVRRLRFDDPAREAEFLAEHARRRAPQLRLVFAVGLAIQLPLSLRTALADDIGLDDPRFWARLAVGVVPALIGLRLLKSARSARFMSTYLLAYTLLIGAVLVVVFVPTHDWLRLPIYLTAACIMSRLRAREAAFVQCVLISWYAIFAVALLDRPSSTLQEGLPNLAFIGLFILVATYLIEQSDRRDFLLLSLLDDERAKSERLLLNILPAPIAVRLKEAPGTVADSLAEVTVLFADLVGSTAKISELTAEDTVELLNEVFTRFDRLTSDRGLEKIKTIGDSYMVAGGLPEPGQEHAEAVVDLAIAMLEGVRDLHWPDGDPLLLRIGVNTGPVVAGVIGASKFIYDLWGDTVNVASRLESTGVPGAVQVGPRTWELVQHQHQGRARRVEIRGKGRMSTRLITPGQTTAPGAAQPVSERALART